VVVLLIKKRGSQVSSMRPGILWFFVISQVHFRDGQKTHPRVNRNGVSLEKKMQMTMRRENTIIRWNFLS
jgi:hypothetical protein